MIEARVEGDDRVVVRLGLHGDQAHREILSTVGSLALRLAVRVKMKLSDDVLHVRTGRLRRSITSKVSDNDSGVTATVGTNLSYAAFQEFGFRGVVNVRQHMRKLVMAWGKPVRSPKMVVVQGHQRHVDYPAHSFLRSALAEMAPEMRDELTKALGRATR